jgi:acetoin utilization deacetylase AcuC-like enzyme
MVVLSTIIISHRAALAHDMGFGHPERPDRLRVVEEVLSEPAFADLPRLEAPEASREALLLAHPAAYVDKLLQIRVGTGERLRLDSDTAMNEGTLPASLRAAGGAVQAVDEVLAKRVDTAFVAMRPPGHHAERATAMGFCFFNNAAIAARHARLRHGLGRVAIVDFDVHHGNGTQDIFWDDASVLYGSTHQMPLYPGTGARGERGDHDTIVNAPLKAGDGSAEFRDAFESLLLPRLDRFAPELVIISAGFDAHHRDPLAQIELREEDFAWATLKLMDVADRHAGGRVVSLLEGGYDLVGLALSTAAHVGALAGTRPSP